MITVEHERIAVGHLLIEAHSRLELTHLLHATHVFILCDNHGLTVLTQCLNLHIELCFIKFRHL